ncbi:MAG: carboxypeptidase-like regulatory domain-containing protein [Flavobacteriaceae bacterium]|nr:carboxypeptidase-like regulatory domain-containing protein [Flavobacteriaceae bacterium]
MAENIHLLLLLSYFIFGSKIAAQNDRRVINGKIVSDSLSVEKIHIINKNTKTGTYTNVSGDFAIPVKVDDTLVFTAVQFELYKRIVSEIDMMQLQLIIRLKAKNNQLEEVIVKSISVAQGLGLPNADKKPLNRTENRLNAHNKSSAPILTLATLLNQRGGIDNIYYILSGKRKRDRKLNKLMLEDKISARDTKALQQIRLHFEDDFFVNTVGIPVERINDFLDFCLKDNIVALYNENRILELIEVFLEENNLYLKLIKN